jgi:glutamate/tyrosine decarboxylase-like PLP-dependent enzyme
MALWIGREYLRKDGKPIIISHNEGHYSLDKAARILDLRIIKTKNKFWNQPLNKDQLKEITKNIRSPLIIVGTLGHTSTGIIDDVKSITEFIKEYKQPCFLHLDSAIGGFFIPFLSQDKSLDFSNPLVKSITFDYHKYGFLYYPSGIFLCRKNLQNYIGSDTEYVKIFDDTLIGSRSGILPAIIWANTEYLNKKGFRKRAIKILLNKNKFIEKLKERNIEFIETPNMPLVCMILKKRLPKSMELKFRIHSIKRKEGYTYTIYFYSEYLKSYEELLEII